MFVAIAKVGRAHPNVPKPEHLAGFSAYLSSGNLDFSRLDLLDGSLTRREKIARFLLLSAVLDQGPDIAGIRFMVIRVLNILHTQGMDILGDPAILMSRLSEVRQAIVASHEEAKELFAAAWAASNKSNAKKYNLFSDNAKQILSYVMFRWGTPLAVALSLQLDRPGTSPLMDHLEAFPSAERMSRDLKDGVEYGLGKAIGDKACHLYAKWICSSVPIVRRTHNGWGHFGFEVPFDSNAGRVLWRTGFFDAVASRAEYQSWQVLQPYSGKGGATYIRVTNVREKAVSTPLPPDIIDTDRMLSVEYFHTHKLAPRHVEIQRLPHSLLFGTGYTPADLDEGLIYIGTRFCLNTEAPQCVECPIRAHCFAHMSSPDLIANYRT